MDDYWSLESLNVAHSLLSQLIFHLSCSKQASYRSSWTVLLRFILISPKKMRLINLFILTYRCIFNTLQHSYKLPLLCTVSFDHDYFIRRLDLAIINSYSLVGTRTSWSNFTFLNLVKRLWTLLYSSGTISINSGYIFCCLFIIVASTEIKEYWSWKWI